MCSAGLTQGVTSSCPVSIALNVFWKLFLGQDLETIIWNQWRTSFPAVINSWSKSYSSRYRKVPGFSSLNHIVPVSSNATNTSRRNSSSVPCLAANCHIRHVSHAKYILAYLKIKITVPPGISSLIRAKSCGRITSLVESKCWQGKDIALQVIPCLWWKETYWWYSCHQIIPKTICEFDNSFLDKTAKECWGEVNPITVFQQAILCFILFYFSLFRKHFLSSSPNISISILLMIYEKQKVLPKLIVSSTPLFMGSMESSDHTQIWVNNSIG